MIANVYQSTILLLIFMNGLFNIVSNALPLSTEFYVVPFPALFHSDNDGSITRPYTSLQQALDHVESSYYREINPTNRITINLYPTHHFVNTIRLTQVHSHIQLTTMTAADTAFYEKLTSQYPHQRLPRATISGGIPITNWTQVSSNTYSAVIPSTMYVNQLFINNQRIVRTRIPTNFSDYLHYAAPLNDSILGRYGFQYQPGQFNYTSLIDAMVVVYHSWTESHHYIDRLIPENHTILFSNPSDRPIGTYVVQGQQRFHIENLCEALVPNSFCFINATKTVYLMTNGTYDPNKVEIITSVNEIVLSLASDDATKPVEDIIINNVVIQHGAWNIDRTRQAEGYGGNVFPCGVGVLVFRATDIVIADNLIHHHQYNGVSAGSQLGYAQSWTTKILIQGNYIHNIGLHILCDQGGIYTLGVQPGTIVHGNVVKNVYSYAVFMWGIYLDEGASDMIVSNNVVYNTGWASLFQHYGANNTIVNNVFARASLIGPPQSGDWLPDGDVRVQLAENHTSWIYTRNIIYDTYQGTNHSAFISDPNATVFFSNNVYYNTYDTPLLDWQKTGQDNDSVIADPLFTGDVNQCDFFTIREDSPAAKLGFVNITKLSKWTPGCDSDETSLTNQFSHW